MRKMIPKSKRYERYRYERYERQAVDLIYSLMFLWVPKCTRTDQVKTLVSFEVVLVRTSRATSVTLGWDDMG